MNTLEAGYGIIVLNAFILLVLVGVMWSILKSWATVSITLMGYSAAFLGIATLAQVSLSKPMEYFLTLTFALGILIGAMAPAPKKESSKKEVNKYVFDHELLWYYPCQRIITITSDDKDTKGVVTANTDAQLIRVPGIGNSGALYLLDDKGGVTKLCDLDLIDDGGRIHIRRA